MQRQCLNVPPAMWPITPVMKSPMWALNWVPPPLNVVSHLVCPCMYGDQVTPLPELQVDFLHWMALLTVCLLSGHLLKNKFLGLVSPQTCKSGRPGCFPSPAAIYIPSLFGLITSPPVIRKLETPQSTAATTVIYVPAYHSNYYYLVITLYSALNGHENIMTWS